MTRRVHIVDYGIGNLFSVRRALEHVGADVSLTSSPSEIGSADRLLLPGVGAFEPCIRNLTTSGLADPVREFAATGRPFLGICVGMQLLFDYSLEFGRHHGLGLIPGHVSPIPNDGRKVPHIGWSQLELPAGRNNWSGTLLVDAAPGKSSAYFVHSYSAQTADPAHRLANVDYEGYTICAAVQRDNVSGFQCHPEKSGTVGLRVLERFVSA